MIQDGRDNYMQFADGLKAAKCDVHVQRELSNRVVI